MSSKKILSEISNFEIQKASIQSLADRPNNVSRYGDGGLTAEELKKRFDAFPRLAQEKINELIRVLSSKEASKYISINNIAGKDNLFDFLALFDDATKESIAKYIQVLYTEEFAAEAKSKPLDEAIADMQARIASNAATTNFNKERLETICPIVIANQNSVVAHSSRLDNHEERLQGIETYLGGDNFILDDAVAYQKVIPANAVGKAKILKIGGMTYKSKNLFDINRTDFVIPNEAARGYNPKVENGILYSGGKAGSSAGSSVPIALKQNTEYTLSLNVSYNATVETTAIVMFALIETPINGIYDVSKQYVISYAINQGLNTVTFNSRAYSHFILVAYSTNQYGIAMSEIMLSEGKDTVYEPYFEGLRSAKVTELKSEGANKFDDSKISYVVQSGGEQSEAFGTVDNGVLIAKKGYYGNILSWHPFKAYLKKGTYTVSADVYIPTGGAPTLSLTLGVVSGTSSNSLTYIKKTEINSYDAWQRASVSIEVGADGTYLLNAQGNGDASMYRNMDVRFKNISITSDSSTDYTPYIKHSLPIPAEAQVSNGINDECYDYLDFSRKKATKNVGFVDLGTLDWSVASNSRFFASPPNMYFANGINEYPIVIMSANYVSSTGILYNAFEKAFYISIDGRIGIKDTSYTDAATFKSAMAGVMLAYKLKEPNIIDVSAYLPNPYIEVEGDGTITAVNEYGYAAPSEIKYLVTYPKEV